VRYFLLNITFLLSCALFLNRNAIAEEGLHCFILTGQSNMSGPLPETFQACVEQVFGKNKVVVAKHNRPASPIKSWYKNWTPPEGQTDEKPEGKGKGNGWVYDELIGKVKQSTKGKKIATTTLIWMQGETDADKGFGSVYEKSFYGVLDQLKNDLQLQQINFVVGRISDYYLPAKDGVLVRTILQKMGEAGANSGWIDTDDLNRGVNTWGGFIFVDGHFPLPGYRVIGQRFARKACLIIDPKIRLDPAIFTENFMDSATQIETHIAIGKAVTGSAPNNKHNANGVALAALTDGKFGKEDPADHAWLGFEPSTGNIEFVLDLGEVQVIKEIAVNLFFSIEAKAECPESITFSTSVDGKEFISDKSSINTIKFGDAKFRDKLRKDGIKPQSVLLLTEQDSKKSRYIKVEIQTGKQWVFLDEIIVNPKKKPSKADQ
jgi:hypothetical protein